MGLFDKFRNGLRKTAQQLTASLGSASGGSAKLTQSVLDEMEEGLVAVDMGAVTAQAIVREVQEQLKNQPQPSREVLTRYLRSFTLGSSDLSHPEERVPSWSPSTLPCRSLADVQLRLTPSPVSDRCRFAPLRASGRYQVESCPRGRSSAG